MDFLMRLVRLYNMKAAMCLKHSEAGATSGSALSFNII